MSDVLPTLKPILTNKGWQKAKGAISKLDGETGVGDALAKVEAAYKQIDFKPLDADNLHGKDRDQEVIDRLRVDQKKLHAAKVEPLRKALAEAARLATAKAGEWKKKPLIPKSAAKAASDVASEANDLAAELKLDGTFMRSYEEGNVRIEQEIERKEKVSRTMIDSGLKLLIAGLKKLKDDPTKETWDAHVHQACRSVCNSVRNIPALKKIYWATWQPFGDNYVKDVQDGGNEEKLGVLTKADNVVKALKVLNANYKADMA